MSTDSLKFKVVIMDTIAEDGINILKYRPNYDVVLLEKDEITKLLIELVDADALVIRSSIQITQETIKEAEKLRLIIRTGSRYDNIDVKACSEKKIIVMTTPTANTNAMAELVLGLMIDLSRHITQSDVSMKQNRWEKTNLVGHELAGKTIGLIGFGNIGTRVAEICHSLGMNIIAFVRNKNKKRSINFQVDFVDMLEDMLPRIDFLSIHAPLTELTAGLIGLEQFELMKPTAYLINTSSGQIVDESDLYHALLDQKIAGVAIDMYSKEPACIMDFPFINLPNVIALPHIGANTYESFSRVSRIIAEHLIDALENNIYVDSVNLPFNITLSQVEEYRPYLLLAQRLGQTLGQYANQQIKEIHIHFRFPNVHEIKPIIMTVCTELLRYQYLDISLVNIQKFLDNLLLNLIVQTKYNLRYENCLNLDVQFDDGTFFSVTGTIVAGIPKIIEIQSVPIEIIPIGHGFLVECLNLPGVLGAIASLLGEYSINISNLNLSQNEIGTTAYVFILTNQETPDEVIEVIKQIDNVLDIRKINFN